MSEFLNVLALLAFVYFEEEPHSCNEFSLEEEEAEANSE